MTDLTNENPLEFSTSAELTATETSDLIDCDMEDYINESMGVAAQRTISIIGNSMSKVKMALVRSTGFYKSPYTPIRSIVGDKGYMDIRDIIVPTMAGFTSTYSDLLVTLEKHNKLLSTLGSDTLIPTLHYLEHIASDKDLLKSRAPSKDVRDYKVVKFDVIRNDIGQHFKNHDNVINRPYGSVFKNLNEYDTIAKSVSDLYHVYTDNSSVNKIISYSERIEAVAQKLYLKYFTDSKQSVAKEVRGEVARLIRDCAVGCETLAFYIHIVSLTHTSLSNITAHLKPRIK